MRYFVRFENGTGWYRVTRFQGVECPNARWIPFDEAWTAWWTSSWIWRSDGWGLLRPWPYCPRHRGNVDMIVKMIRQCCTCVRLDAMLARTFLRPGPAASQESFLHWLSEQFYKDTFDIQDRFATDDRFGGGIRVLSTFRPEAKALLSEESGQEWSRLELANVDCTRRWRCNRSAI